MKLKVFALFFLLHALLVSAKADDRLYFHTECSPGQNCIDLTDESGNTKSVLSVPAYALARADIKSASVQMAGNTPQALNIELSEEASKKIEKITGENIGKRLMVVLDGKIVIAPTILEPIRAGNLMISRGPSDHSPFWESVPWLQELLRDSDRARGRPITIYVIIASAALIAAFAFILVPRMRRANHSSSEQ